MTESITTAVRGMVTALREELTQYGEMLALLEQQQESAINRMADEMLAATSSIQGQAGVLQSARRVREEAQRAVALELCVVETSTFVELIPLLPADYRPLVASLVEENNHLLQRVQQRARQNHLLLSRSVEVMQQFLGTLFPARDTQVYNEHGGRQLRSLPIPPLYEAVG